MVNKLDKVNNNKKIYIITISENKQIPSSYISLVHCAFTANKLSRSANITVPYFARLKHILRFLSTFEHVDNDNDNVNILFDHNIQIYTTDLQ